VTRDEAKVAFWEKVYLEVVRGVLIADPAPAEMEKEEIATLCAVAKGFADQACVDRESL
jgi:hypothetical protein